MRRRIVHLFSVVCVAYLCNCFALPVFAVETTVRYTIQSEHLHYEPEKNSIALKNNVVITTSTYVVHGDEAEILLTKASQRDTMADLAIDTITMRGNVRFSYTREKDAEPIQGNSKQAKYDAINEVIYMYGNARVVVQGNVIEGDTIRFHLPSGAIEVTGATKKPVEVIIEKKEDK